VPTKEGQRVEDSETLHGARWYIRVMRRLLPLLLVSLLLGQGLVALSPQGLDACAGSDCSPVTCSQACAACVCAIDRDRLAPPRIPSIPLLEPLRETPHSVSVVLPQPRARDILHVPKLFLV
jgi:hypothetical protein